MGLREPHMVPGIKPGLTVFEVDTFPAVLFLSPYGNIFEVEAMTVRGSLSALIVSTPEHCPLHSSAGVLARTT